MNHPDSLVRYPHSSRRSALLCSEGVVATSQPLAAQAGLRMLLEGGNAVDAALACAVALTVVEPVSNGIGGDAFALVWDGERLHGLNGSGRAAAALDPEALRASHEAFPEWGWPGVTVPGAPDAWRTLHARFAKLELERIVAPAIAYAERGYPVSPVVSGAWAEAAARYPALGLPELAGWEKVFAPRGAAPAAGERWSSPGHAAGLRLLVARGLRDFYEGEVASRILAYSGATGGLFRAEDLASHHSEWVTPISVTYRDHEVWEIPPNGQGIAALQALGMLDGLPAPESQEERWHLQMEAMKLAFADAYRFVADPAVVEVPQSGLLDPDYLAGRRALIGERARAAEAGSPSRGGTVYLCAVDRDGLMVSYIQSNFMGFGSGVVVPELGIAFQNRGACFVLEPGHPNAAAPGKRPRHTIIPAFLTREGAALGPFGVMGGEMQPQGHVQVLGAMLEQGLNPQAALDMARWRVLGGLDAVAEPQAPPRVLEGLRARGHRIETETEPSGFGRGQIIMRCASGAYVAGSEPRADGGAVGY